ncbi:hypothetical protein DAH21_11355 [Escherichia coli]|nr:hypothetical protein A6V11_19155 [Escherichia coli]PDU53001.1 hypothetical protein A6V10_00960 [Escherichia coli]PDU55658.1 hypothetical protein A6V09_18365 [Escherichia coli]PDU94829.1 hypothetical protein A6V02_16325 [Escherichia coli]PDV01726.1 hypothetical protein A6V00_08640 [Escherichia coli]
MTLRCLLNRGDSDCCNDNYFHLCSHVSIIIVIFINCKYQTFLTLIMFFDRYFTTEHIRRFL